MRRRKFLQLAIPAAAIALEAKSAGMPPTQAGFKVDSDKDRFSAGLPVMGGRFDLKVSGRDTGGALCIYHTVREEKGGPALHLHHEQDEWFYVISGEFIVKVGDDTFHLGPGDSALAPRKIPHTFAKISEGGARMLILFQPAGTMEDFFKEMSKLGNAIPANQERNLKDLWARHSMELLGPPLKLP
jgi:mannose-6-phosphate isomerase-like protein (cupin superfamily)